VGGLSEINGKEETIKNKLEEIAINTMAFRNRSCLYSNSIIITNPNTIKAAVSLIRKGSKVVKPP
jgi:hypothetical protein